MPCWCLRIGWLYVWESPFPHIGIGSRNLFNYSLITIEKTIILNTELYKNYSNRGLIILSLGIFFSSYISKIKIQVNNHSFEIFGIKYVSGFRISSVLKRKYSLCTKYNIPVRSIHTISRLLPRKTMGTKRDTSSLSSHFYYLSHF